MNGAIDTPTTEQTVIGRIDNGVYGKRGDIGTNDFDYFESG